MDTTAQIIVAFVFGLAFLITLITLAVKFPEPTPFQYSIFRTVLALAAAGVGAMIPGFLDVDLNHSGVFLVRAGGALAVFVIVYFLNPAHLATGATQPPPSRSRPHFINDQEPVVTKPSGYELVSTNGGTFMMGSDERDYEKPIPKTDKKRFSVLVANLENDPNNEFKELILEAIHEFEGVQTLPLNHEISLTGPELQKMEILGHEKALQYLKQSGADVLIWGKILRFGEDSTPKLYWSQTHSEKAMFQRYPKPREADLLGLPEVYWRDLIQTLRLLIASRWSEFACLSGHYVADLLIPFINQVRMLVEQIVNRPECSSEDRGTINLILANALSFLGEQRGENEALEHAIKYYQQALKEYNRERVPRYWGLTQNNLGNALLSLGERESGTQRLGEAVTAYREALKEYTREQAPLSWVMIQNNLGAALLSLGEREFSTKSLEKAVNTFQEALKEYTREQAPLSWAMNKNNLGVALLKLGERESGTDRFEEAMTAFRDALKEFTREGVPLYWASALKNMGIALFRLGERESDTKKLEEAVAVYREVLEVFTYERTPLDYAMTLSNLGNVLSNLGKRENSKERFEEAVVAYQEARNVFKEVSANYYLQAVTKDLNRVLTFRAPDPWENRLKP